MSATRPNIVFIFTDQQSADMMSCAGNPHVRTPWLDRLAARGTRFERAYCTNPLCVPSRFSLMTGRLPGDIGLYRNASGDIPPIPDAFLDAGLGWRLRAGGYRTVYGGKVHLPKRTPIERLGFEVLTTDERNELASSAARFLREHDDGPFALVTSFINPHDICHLSIRDFPDSDFAQAVLRGATQELACLDEALVRPAGVDDEAFFRDHCPPLPDNLEPQADEPEAISRQLDSNPSFQRRARAEWGEREWRLHRYAYARLTEAVDAQIGRVLETLWERDDADETLVVFSSDHGEMAGAHRLEQKGFLYDDDTRIPLIVSHPAGQAAAGRVDTTSILSNGLDLLPTLCDYAGLTLPQELRGRSWRPLVEEDGAAWEREVVPIENESGLMVVGGRYEYARYHDGANAEQLYDLEADPGQTRNAAGDGANEQALAAMRAAWEREFGGAGATRTGGAR